ncbi:hypothetical protein EYF80_022594 [Liparis tanakae]|uniref:Uncharacterized protein n=1 Tax=Liparis tanakae TaxID=230148 RepID=A0A4Z2HN50_9TELE|nr:hypothetical protein EYF80_022594 [Liparis tanakae]
MKPEPVLEVLHGFGGGLAEEGEGHEQLAGPAGVLLVLGRLVVLQGLVEHVLELLHRVHVFNMHGVWRRRGQTHNYNLDLEDGVVQVQKSGELRLVLVHNVVLGIHQLKRDTGMLQMNAIDTAEEKKHQWEFSADDGERERGIDGERERESMRMSETKGEKKVKGGEVRDGEVVVVVVVELGGIRDTVSNIIIRDEYREEKKRLDTGAKRERTERTRDPRRLNERRAPMLTTSSLSARSHSVVKALMSLSGTVGSGMAMPTVRHFMKRQAWHDLRLLLVISHSLVAGQLYSMLPITTHSNPSTNDQVDRQRDKESTKVEIEANLGWCA